MSGFDVAVGIHQNALNTTVLPQVYSVLYPALLKPTINVNEIGISTVEVDIQAPATVNLSPSAKAVAHITSAIEKLYSAKKGASAQLTTAHKSEMLKLASSATFSANLPKVAATVNYASGSSPTKVDGSLEVHATVTVDGSDSDLTVKILSGAVTIPKDPDLADLLNKALLPNLIEYLNTKILNSIKIPTLQFGSLKVSAPLPVVQNLYFEAFSRLGSSSATIPDSFPWPSEKGICIAVDIPMLEAAARLKFPLGPKKSFNWDNIVSGEVGAQVKTPVISTIHDNGNISASIEAEADCQLTLHTPPPFHNISFGPRASATLDATLHPSVHRGELFVAIEDIPQIHFKFDFGIPGWLDWFFKPIEEALSLALNAVLFPLIAGVLHDVSIPVYKIRSIPLKFDGGKIDKKMNIIDAVPSGVNGSVLVIVGQTQISD